MRRLSFKLGLIAALATSTTSAGWSVALAADVEGGSYSKTYDTCMDKAGGVTSSMRDCHAAEFRRQDSRLNSNYQKAMAGFDAAHKEKLRAVQRLWIQVRDGTCDLVSAHEDGGTIALLESDDCILSMTAARADQLEDMLPQE